MSISFLEECLQELCAREEEKPVRKEVHFTLCLTDEEPTSYVLEYTNLSFFATFNFQYASKVELKG